MLRTQLRLSPRLALVHLGLSLTPVPISLLGCTSGSDGQGAEASETPAKEDSREWVRIIEGDWELDAGGEIPQQCVQQVLEEDVYVSAIRPVHPEGTHHTLVTLGDGSVSCTSSLVSNGIIYAAGVGSEGLDLPPGVAMKFPKGSVLSMGLHLYNVTDGVLRGTSAMEIVRLAPEEVRYEAEALLAGPFQLTIPPGRQTISGDCNVSSEQSFFAIFPHMHQLGVHLKTTLTVGGTPRVIHDGAYDFEEQEQIAFDPITLLPGDTISTECTYENTTGKTVTFGESSDTEMCFSILFRYPAQGRAFCTSGPTVTVEGPPCAAPGATGNERGIGRECTRGGGQCPESTLCLATFVEGEFPNFCTTTCTDDSACGAGAKCSGTGARAICVPDACVEMLASVPDAGG